ncbi:U-scoloptoxin(16)-Er12a-like [Periplaneta americana]|uniref:U-scoloptoxin(16)-Er12a-like n=1 Tax=Periplaneta americana TaxID=6978 RepID=UPI0037E9479C
MNVTIMVSIFLIAVTWQRHDVNGAPSHKAEFSGQCLDDETQKSYSVGKTWSSSSGCLQYSCVIYEKIHAVIEISGCLEVYALPPCYVKKDTNATYPDCCPNVVCPKKTVRRG